LNQLMEELKVARSNAEEMDSECTNLRAELRRVKSEMERELEEAGRREKEAVRREREVAERLEGDVKGLKREHAAVKAEREALEIVRGEVELERRRTMDALQEVEAARARARRALNDVGVAWEKGGWEGMGLGNVEGGGGGGVVGGDGGAGGKKRVSLEHQIGAGGGMPWGIGLLEEKLLKGMERERENAESVVEGGGERLMTPRLVGGGERGSWVTSELGKRLATLEQKGVEDPLTSPRSPVDRRNSQWASWKSKNEIMPFHEEVSEKEEAGATVAPPPVSPAASNASPLAPGGSASKGGAGLRVTAGRREWDEELEGFVKSAHKASRAMVQRVGARLDALEEELEGSMRREQRVELEIEALGGVFETLVAERDQLLDEKEGGDRERDKLLSDLCDTQAKVEDLQSQVRATERQSE
jgi:hypothetical protein